MGQTLLSPWEGGRSTCSLDFIQSSVALVPLCSLAWGSVLRTNREWCRAQAFNHTAFFGSRAFHFCLGSHPPMDTEQYDGICLPFFFSVHTHCLQTAKNVTRLFDLPYLMKWERQSHSNLLVRIYDLLSFDREPAVLNLLCESSPALWLNHATSLSLPVLSFLAVSCEPVWTSACLSPVCSPCGFVTLHLTATSSASGAVKKSLVGCSFLEGVMQWLLRHLMSLRHGIRERCGVSSVMWTQHMDSCVLSSSRSAPSTGPGWSPSLGYTSASSYGVCGTQIQTRL